MKITKQDVHEVIDFISQIEKIRGRDPMRVFRKGNCGSLYGFLEMAFPDNITAILTSYSGSDERLVQGHHIVARIHNNVEVNPADWIKFAEKNYMKYEYYGFFNKFVSGEKVMKPTDEIMGLLEDSAESKMKRKKLREQARNMWEPGVLLHEDVLGFFDIGKDFDIVQEYKEKRVPDNSLLGPTIKFGFGRTSENHQSYLEEEVTRMNNTKKLLEMFIECKRKGVTVTIDIAEELHKLGDPGFEKIAETDREK
ncbi:MAG: hypothetical protein FWE31_03105 [Firmicutes bacterium]|nr:hypothetical protein [Bacillota bacterium]